MATIEEINAKLKARELALTSGVAVPLQPQNQGQNRPMTLSEINSRILMRERVAREQIARPQQPEAVPLQPNNTNAPLGNEPALSMGRQALDVAKTTGNQIIGGIEAAGTVLQNTAVDAIGGLGALAGGLDPSAERGTGVANLEKIRGLLSYQPRTEEARNILKSFGELLQPIAEPIEAARQSLNDETLRRTGSPVAAGVASALPDLALEVVGFGPGARAAKANARAVETQQLQNRSVAEIARQEKETGIPQITSDVFQPKTRLGSFMQTAGELAIGKKRSAQQETRIKSVGNLVEKFNVEDGAQYESRIIDSFKNTIDAKKSGFSQQYANSSKELDKFGAVALTKVKEWAQTEISKQLRLGSQGDTQKINDLKALIDAPDDLSFELVKEIRSGIGNKLEQAKRGAPVQGSSDVGFLSQAYKQLSGDMRDFANFSSPSLAQQWKAADADFSAFATGANKNAAKQALKNGEATPEVINSLLFSSKNSDIQFLADNLDADGLVASKQAIIQKMASKATNADGEVSPNRFIKQLEDNRNRIGKIFSKEETRGISALKDALSSTRRAQDSAITTPTGQQLAPQAITLILVTEPLAITPTVVQYLIETKVTRDLLIKRKAAKTVKQRQQIGAELQAEMRERGLISAAVTGAAIPQQEEK
jgi:hypothetical protein